MSLLLQRTRRICWHSVGSFGQSQENGWGLSGICHDETDEMTPGLMTCEAKGGDAPWLIWVSREQYWCGLFIF